MKKNMDMKKVLLLMLLVVTGFTCKMSAQMTENPLVDNTKASGAYVAGVLVTPDITAIALRVSIGYGEWVRVSPQTKIEYNNPQTGTLETRQILRLRDVNGGALSMGTKYTYLPSNAFWLEFPSLPKGLGRLI